MTKAPKPDPEKLYQPLMGFTNKVGTYKPGDRLRGDDPAVTLTPELWVEEGLSDVEEQATFIARFGPDARRSSPHTH
jgi:hypothetical protein